MLVQSRWVTLLHGQAHHASCHSEDSENASNRSENIVLLIIFKNETGILWNANINCCSYYGRQKYILILSAYKCCSWSVRFCVEILNVAHREKIYRRSINGEFGSETRTSERHRDKKSKCSDNSHSSAKLEKMCRLCASHTKRTVLDHFNVYNNHSLFKPQWTRI